MNAETGIEQATPETARYLTDRIKVALEGTWQLIAEAYVSRAWAALGYGTWDEYCTREFGTTRLRLPREERQEVVASLRESGLSTRAIAAATGQSHTQVQRDIAGGTNVPPAQSDNELPGVAYEEGGHPATASAHVTPPPVPSPPAPAPRPTITGSDGRSYPASRPQPPPPPPLPSWDDDEIVEAEIVEEGSPDNAGSVQAVIDQSAHAQAYRDAGFRKQLATELGRLSGLGTFPPERIVAVSDDDLLFLIDSVCTGIRSWHSEITRLRKPGLRVVSGGA